MENTTMNNTTMNANATTINYISNYWKNKPTKETFETFFNQENSTKTAKKQVEIKRLIAQLEAAQNELEIEYSKLYNKKFMPSSQTPYFEYTNRKGTKYCYDMNGMVTESNNEEDIEGPHRLYYLGTKTGEISVVTGYCLELAAVVIKKFKYTVSQDCYSCRFTLLDEILLPLFFVEEEDRYGGARRYLFGRHTSYSTYCYDNLLRETNCTEFVNALYGINRKIPFTLEKFFIYYTRNKSMEVILKTAPDDVLSMLMEEKIEEVLPVAKILGLTTEVYQKAVAKNLTLAVYYLRGYIFNKEKFHKTDVEWLDLIEEMEQKENDLKFFHIHYTDWRNNSLTSCQLLYLLAYSYDHNELFSKNYSFGKFCNYVIEESINQGYTALRDFIEQLGDYLKMCEDQDIVPTLYSSYLKQTHDIAARNHRVMLDEESEKLFAKRYEGFKSMSIKLDKGTDKEVEYQVLAPVDSDDVKHEGDMLNHCVASYIKRILDGTTKIFFLRKDPLQSLITLEVRDGRITQARGLHNRRPTLEESRAIKLFAEKKELEIRC